VKERSEETLQELAPEPAVAAAPAVGPALNSGTVLALQRTAGNGAVGSLLSRASADESVARALARHRADEEPPRSRFRSPALQLRSDLRGARLARAVTTVGGEWDTDVYDIKQDDNGRGPAPAAQNWRGADITLKFKPGIIANAEQIGLSQSVTSVVGGKTNLTPGAAARPIPAADAKATDVPGETDEGAAIDQSESNTNPMYAVENASSTTLADKDDTRFGEHGFRFKDAKGVLQEHTAVLKDGPRRPGADKNSHQIFETTALATKGAQAGMYYGSVRWGWRTDAAGAFTKIDLVKVSEGVPSSTFLKAGEIWNASKTPTGNKDTVDLPIPDVKVVSTAVTINALPGAIPLPVGTRVVIVKDLVPPATSGTIRVVDGMHHGLQGDVSAAEWPNITDERS
jgi:hypothetical protein